MNNNNNHMTAVAAPGIDWQHIANEYADAACNGVQWLRNVRDGISTVDDALADMEANYARIQNLQIDASPKGAGLPVTAASEAEQALDRLEGFATRRRWGYARMDDFDVVRAALSAALDSHKGGSEARDAVVVEGTVEFRRSSTSEPKLCVCCPGEPSHIFGRSVNWEGECWAQFNALETAIRKHFTYKNENEGRRLRVTIEVVQAQAGDAEVQP